MSLHRCKKGQLVIRQGDEGDRVYVVESGEYAAFLEQGDGQPVSKYKRSELVNMHPLIFFGEPT